MLKAVKKIMEITMHFVFSIETFMIASNCADNKTITWILLFKLVDPLIDYPNSVCMRANFPCG